MESWSAKEELALI
jgi:hypothetical protein